MTPRGNAPESSKACATNGSSARCCQPEECSLVTGRNKGTTRKIGGTRDDVPGFSSVLRVLALLLALPLVLCLTGPAAAETRVALVIGIKPNFLLAMTINQRNSWRFCDTPPRTVAM